VVEGDGGVVVTFGINEQWLGCHRSVMWLR
jgi:hypothetical protein